MKNLYVIEREQLEKYRKDKEMLSIYEKLLKNKKILHLTALGKTSKEIEKIMGLSDRTVEAYIHAMCKLVGCRNRLGLIRIACWLKIIE